MPKGQSINKLTQQTLAIIYLSALGGWLSSPALAAVSTAEPNSLFEMSLQDLMDIPIVVSASRSEQKITDSPVPITIITAEDIHFSGLTNIPEILQFFTGVDAARQDRTRYIVGVHGMHSEYSDRTLVLIDGRNALNPVFGAPNWLNLPIFVEDIERIEITRGPAGAAWGANAFTGVINIITKKPGQTGNLVSTTVTEYGDSFTQTRLAGSKGKWAWRVSAGYEEIEDSDSAGAGRYQIGYPEMTPLIPLQTYRTRDFLRASKMDSVFSYDLSESAKWTFGAAYSANQAGDRELCSRFPQKDISIEMTRLFSRADFGIDEDVHGYLQWYGNYAAYHTPFLVERYDFFENDIEGQVTVPLSENNKITTGGNVRWTRIRNRNQTTFGEIVFDDDRYEEYWTGFFLSDQFDLTERLTLEAQGRIDRYSESSTDWSLRLSSIYALDNNRKHLLRAGVGRSFRAPGIMLRNTTLLGMMGLINVVPPPEKLENESVYSLEAGYSGWITDRLLLRADTYYQRMEDLIGSIVVSEFGPIQNNGFANVDGANAWGAECELTYQMNPFTISGFYSFNRLQTDRQDQNIRAFFPSEHKAGLRLRWKPDEKWAVNVNYVYNDCVPLNGSENPPDDIEVKNRLDMTVSRKLWNGNGELMIGVIDLLNETADPVYDISYFTSYETPGRTFFGRLQISF